MLISYTPGLIQTVDGDALAAVSNLVISTATINTYAIPGKIEAENFESNSGWTAETCSDDGAGYDMGYTDAGDYLDYRVEVAQAGRYRIDFRLSSGNSAGGKAELLLLTGNELSSLISFAIPYTGGWQTWLTMSKEIMLPAGIQTLRLRVDKKEFNLNWMNTELLMATATDDLAAKASSLSVYPNPASSELWIDCAASNGKTARIDICDLSGRVLLTTTSSQPNVKLSVQLLKTGMYLVKVTDAESTGSSQLMICH